MSFKNIKIKNFLSRKKKIKKKKELFNLFKNLINSDNQILSSMDKSYKDSYTRKLILSLKNIKNVNLIGMGGSSLGAKAIYSFLKPKKKFYFIDNFSNLLSKTNNSKNINLIISKSGNTLETISNINVLTYKSKKNIFITENKKSYLMSLANKLKAEVIHHNNFIGGRYSVLSEVGMLPADLMGFQPKKFRRLNQLLKNKKYINFLIQGVSNILTLNKNNKTNSIILNYDDKSNELFSWYQQLVAESLGKNNKGILPVISVMPRDNHSLMQHYLDGAKNNFFTLFFVKEKNSKKINNKSILNPYSHLKNKSLNDISFSQFCATEKVFKKKKLPFRSFIIEKRNEEVLGELFTFFILETILLGMAMKINPYDQPAVELIKIYTKKFLKNN
jgi:glucose-6-phosphate isomerase